MAAAGPLAFCVRPGLRLWRCDLDGTVQLTHMYKDLIDKTHCIKLQGEASLVRDCTLCWFILSLCVISLVFALL